MPQVLLLAPTGGRRIGAVKDGQEVIDNRTRVKTVKNKRLPGMVGSTFGSARGSARRVNCWILPRKQAS